MGGIGRYGVDCGSPGGCLAILVCKAESGASSGNVMVSLHIVGVLKLCNQGSPRAIFPVTAAGGSISFPQQIAVGPPILSGNQWCAIRRARLGGYSLRPSYPATPSRGRVGRSGRVSG